MNTLSANRWNRTSQLFLLLAGALLLLVHQALPEQSLASGRYMSLLHWIVGDSQSTGEPQMRATPILALTELRVVAMLYVATWLTALISLGAGLRARMCGEASLGHAGPIVLSLCLMFIAARLHWVLRW